MQRHGNHGGTRDVHGGSAADFGGVSGGSGLDRLIVCGSCTFRVEGGVGALGPCSAANTPCASPIGHGIFAAAYGAGEYAGI